MKQLSTLLLFLCLGTAAMAQVGIKAGVNFTNMLFEEDEVDIENLVDNGATNYAVGAEFILPFGGLIALQPELLYAKKGAESKYTLNGQEYSNELSYHYLEIPLLLRISLGDTYGEGLGVYANAGGYAAYALSGKTKIKSPLGDSEMDISFDEDDDQKRLDYGIAAGAGITIGNLFLEVRYQHGINNLLDDDANNNNDNGFNKLQHRGIGINLGLIF